MACRYLDRLTATVRIGQSLLALTSVVARRHDSGFALPGEKYVDDALVTVLRSEDGEFAAVDDEVRSGDPLGAVGGEVGDRFGDVVRVSRSAEGDR